VVEGRLHQSSLASPVISLTKGKPVADEGAVGAMHNAFDDLSVICHQYVRDVVGVIDEEDLLPEEPEGNQITVPVGRGAQEFQGAVSQTQRMPEEGSAFWSRWHCGGRHLGSSLQTTEV
jgi:hypothetical protein